MKLNPITRVLNNYIWTERKIAKQKIKIKNKKSKKPQQLCVYRKKGLGLSHSVFCHKGPRSSKQRERESFEDLEYAVFTFIFCRMFIKK